MLIIHRLLLAALLVHHLHSLFASFLLRSWPVPQGSFCGRLSSYAGRFLLLLLRFLFVAVVVSVAKIRVFLNRFLFPYSQRIEYNSIAVWLFLPEQNERGQRRRRRRQPGRGPASVRRKPVSSCLSASTPPFAFPISIQSTFLWTKMLLRIQMVGTTMTIDALFCVRSPSISCKCVQRSVHQICCHPLWLGMAVHDDKTMHIMKYVVFLERALF